MPVLPMLGLKAISALGLAVSWRVSDSCTRHSLHELIPIIQYGQACSTNRESGKALALGTRLRVSVVEDSSTPLISTENIRVLRTVFGQLRM
jgi:hypothetical protein